MAEQPSEPERGGLGSGHDQNVRPHTRHPDLPPGPDEFLERAMPGMMSSAPNGPVGESASTPPGEGIIRIDDEDFYPPESNEG